MPASTSASAARPPKLPDQPRTMNAKINLKSALLGLAVGVLTMLVIGAATGRYRVSASSGYVTITAEPQQSSAVVRHSRPAADRPPWE